MPKKFTYLFLSLFLFATLSGILRKWIFQSTATGNIVFAFLLIFPFLFFVIINKQAIKIFSNRGFLIYLLLLIIEALNPLNLTIYHGLLGIIIHSYIWILLFFYIENRELLFFEKGIVYVFLLIIIGETILGFIQYQLPQDSFLNRYADAEKLGGNFALVGSAVRITGTFSYIGGFTAFMIFYVFFVWVLLKKSFFPFITLSILAGGIVASFMTGSRGCTYLYFITIPFILIAEIDSLKRLKKSNIVAPLILLTLMYVLNGDFGSFQKKIEATYQNFDERRTTLAQQGEEKGRITGDLLEIWNFRGDYPIFGVGLGSTYQGATALYGTSEYVQNYGYYEGESARVILEGGFLLFFARIVFTIYVVSLLKLPKLIKVFLFLLLLYLVNYTFNIYNAIYLAFGIILLDNAYYRSSLSQTEVEESTAIEMANEKNPSL